MRILSLSNAYLPHAGGIEVLLDATCGPLLEAGHELLIVTGDGGNPPPGPVTDDEWLRPTPGVGIERLDVEGPLRARDIRGIRRTHERVRVIVEEFRPDVVHAHDVGPLLWMYQQATSGGGPPLVVTMHTILTRYDEIPEGGVRASGRMLERAEIVTGVSLDVVDDIVGFAPGLVDRVVHLPTGIPAPSVPVVAVDRTQAVSVARLVPYKDHPLAVDALAAARRRQPAMRLDILGEGPEFHTIGDHIAAAGLEGAVRLLGRRPRDEVLARIAGSSCLVMSSRFEGLPLVALEAAWASRPIVAFDVPGVREAVVHGETGILVPFGDVEGMGDAIAALTDDPERADRLGANGNVRVRERHGIDRYVRDLLAVLDDAIAGSGSGGRH